MLRLNKRQKEMLQVQIDNEKAVLKKLEGNYKDALDEINSKIELLLARQDADMQHVIYQVEYQRALRTQVQSILENLQTNEFETIAEYLAKSYEDGFIGTMYDLQGQGIPLIFPLDQKAVVDAIQNDTKLSESLYTRLGHDIIDLKKKITGEISRGLSSGQMYSEISRNIALWARIPKNNAMRITRTEAHRIQCKATADAQHRAKEKGADVVKQWDSTLDSKTRESHVAMDGEIAELDDTFSNGLEYPGDPKGSAEEVINCRCALLQRARWALGNDYTKWSEDAPIVYSDDGTAQLAIIEAKNYEDFQEQYKQASEQVREGAQKMNDDAVKSAIKGIEDEDRGLEYECGAVVGKDGTVLKRFKGTEHAVEVSDDDLKMMEGAIFTHNHPLGVFFSDNDIETGFVKTKLGELRASTPQGITYVLKSNGNTTESAYEFIRGYRQARMRANRTGQTEIINRVKLGEITMDDYKKNYYQYYRQYEDDMLVKYAEKHAEEFGFIFEVEKK